jgi:hypothetical protein
MIDSDMGKYTEVLSILLSEKQMKYLRELSRETGKSMGELVRGLIDEQMASEEAEVVYVKLDKHDVKLLQEIFADTNIYDISEMLSYSIVILHVLARSGIFKLLRPLPELAREVSGEGE